MIAGWLLSSLFVMVSIAGLASLLSWRLRPYVDRVAAGLAPRLRARPRTRLKNPIIGRNAALWPLFAMLATASSSGHAQAVLTEAEVIRLARTASPVAEATAASRALATARARAAGMLPNPSVAWGRETVETGRPTGSQDIVSASLPTDWVRPQAAAAQAEAAGLLDLAEVVGRGEQTVLRVVLLYHEAVLAEQECALARQALDILAEVSRVLSRRLEAGSASGYEVNRLTIERELRLGALARAQAHAKAARAALAVWLDLPTDQVALPDSLSMLPEEQVEDLLSRDGTAHPVATQLKEATARARLASERSAWTWLPTLELVGGVKHVSDLGGGYGYVVFGRRARHLGQWKLSHYGSDFRGGHRGAG